MAVSPITIRPGTPQDATSISNLGSYVFSSCFGYSVAPHELKAYLDEFYSLEAIEKDLLDPNKQFLVATTKNLTVSTPDTNVDINVNGDAGNFYNVTVTNSDIDNQTNTDAGREGQTEESVVGFIQLTRGTTEPCLAHIPSSLQIELQRIYIHPNFHGSGTGKALSDAAETLAKSQGFKHIWLGVWEENFKAQKAYAKWGYARVGSHDFTIGGVVQTDLIMVKAL